MDFLATSYSYYLSVTDTFFPLRDIFALLVGHLLCGHKALWLVVVAKVTPL